MNRLVGVGRIRLAADGPIHPREKTADRSSVRTEPHCTTREHLPNDDETACSTCGYTYTKDRPLCPPVVQALRTLTARAHTRALGTYTTDQLRTIEREHCGTGRCRRCGFVYTPTVRACPTSRRIAVELQARLKAPMSEVRAGQGLCAGKGQVWTVSGNKSAPWRRAVATCHQCPLLASCTTELDRRLASGEKIRDQILAGRLFSGKGDEITPEMFDTYADRCGVKTKPRGSTSQPRAARRRTVPTSTPEDRQPPTSDQVPLVTPAVA